MVESEISQVFSIPTLGVSTCCKLETYNLKK